MNYLKEWVLFILVLLLISFSFQMISVTASYVASGVTGFVWGWFRGNRLYGGLFR